VQDQLNLQHACRGWVGAKMEQMLIRMVRVLAGIWAMLKAVNTCLHGTAAGQVGGAVRAGHTVMGLCLRQDAVSDQQLVYWLVYIAGWRWVILFHMPILLTQNLFACQ
jgi:hypothetical protein